jgi:hypothetical protein
VEPRKEDVVELLELVLATLAPLLSDMLVLTEEEEEE